MNAILVDQPGGPEQLALGSYPRPRIGEGDLLVRVRATALNRADLLQREGKYPPPKGASELLGLEAAGEVVGMGAGCTGWSDGDRVCALLPGGGYAQYVAVPHEMAMPIPARLSFEEAAAVPEVFLTAYQALHWLGRMSSSSTVLIHAGASGVGTAAIQLVTAAGGTAIVTASAPKHEKCLELGASLAIDYKTESFADRVHEVTDGKGADLVVDFIGAPYFTSNIEALATDGRIVILATLGGSHVEAFNLRDLFRKRGQVITSTLRSRSRAYKIELTRDFARHAMPLFESGKLRPVIDRVYDWGDVRAAHERMGANENVGKIVLRVDGTESAGA